MSVNFTRSHRAKNEDGASNRAKQCCWIPNAPQRATDKFVRDSAAHIHELQQDVKLKSLVNAMSRRAVIALHGIESV